VSLKILTLKIVLQSGKAVLKFTGEIRTTWGTLSDFGWLTPVRSTYKFLVGRVWVPEFGFPFTTLSQSPISGADSSPLYFKRRPLFAYAIHLRVSYRLIPARVGSPTADVTYITNPGHGWESNGRSCPEQNQSRSRLGIQRPKLPRAESPNSRL